MLGLDAESPSDTTGLSALSHLTAMRGSPDEAAARPDEGDRESDQDIFAVITKRPKETKQRERW